MKTKNKTPDAKNHSKSTQPKAQTIKLGLDVHLKEIVVVRQIDNSLPQPPMRFSSQEAFLTWAQKQTLLADKVHSCYEAGPFGYGLHRRLCAQGIDNLVVVPERLDARHPGVKTDNIDARELCSRLDRYTHGNPRALAIVRPPTPLQEEERSWPRMRNKLGKDRKRAASRGTSLLHYHSIPFSGTWWKVACWKELQNRVPPFIKAELEFWRKLVLLLEEEIEDLKKKIASKAKPHPAGVGAYSAEVARREVLDWNRFNNRREVASMTGLCPGVDSSGQRHEQRSITKHGNPVLRMIFIEMAWRLTRFQPGYKRVKQFRKRLLAHPHSMAVKKKAIVALARQLAIDMWRIETGRCRAEELGLKMNLL